MNVCVCVCVCGCVWVGVGVGGWVWVCGCVCVACVRAQCVALMRSHTYISSIKLSHIREDHPIIRTICVMLREDSTWVHCCLC